jgi:hypothetical protein
MLGLRIAHGRRAAIMADAVTVLPRDSRRAPIRKSKRVAA